MKGLKTDYEKKPRIGAFVDQNIYNLAKAKGAMEGKTISDVVEELLKDYVSDIVDTAKSASEVTNFVNAGEVITRKE